MRAVIVTAAQFAAGQLHLHEERLARLAPRPVGGVVNLGVPLEVVVRLAKTAVTFAFLSGSRDLGQAAANAGVVAGLLEQRRNRLDARGQMNLHSAAAAAVVMSADAGLIHAGD